VNGQPHTTLLELAKKAGKATGDVSTAALQDATPAAVFAHVTNRRCYGPKATTKKCPKNAIENGGLGSITEQMLKVRADVMLGGGAKRFTETVTAGQWKDKALHDVAVSEGFNIVTDLDSLKAVKAANQKQPLLGLFSKGNMPVRWKGPKASHYGNIDQAAVKCEINAARTASIPTLADMTEKAINLLNTNKNGFFLQVEGASIDKREHRANPCGQIGETVDLDEAVQKAL